MPPSRETTAPARAPKSNRRTLPRCMHGCNSEMTSTDLVCVPTSSSPAIRLVPSLPAAAQPSRHILLLAPLAAGGDLAIGAELDVPAPCPRSALLLAPLPVATMPCCSWRCRWKPCYCCWCAAALRVEERWRGPLTDGEDEDEKILPPFQIIGRLIFSTSSLTTCFIQKFVQNITSFVVTCFINISISRMT